MDEIRRLSASVRAQTHEARSEVAQFLPNDDDAAADDADDADVLYMHRLRITPIGFLHPVGAVPFVTS
jgi:hypothetical protein